MVYLPVRYSLLAEYPLAEIVQAFLYHCLEHLWDLLITWDHGSEVPTDSFSRSKHGVPTTVERQYRHVQLDAPLELHQLKRKSLISVQRDASFSTLDELVPVLRLHPLDSGTSAAPQHRVAS